MGVAVFLTAASASAANAKAEKSAVLWDYWYSISVNGKMNMGYYNEKAELRKGRVYVQTHSWKKEGDFINEEQLGAYAEDNAELTPLFFNSHANYRGTEINVDATVTDGHKLSASVKQGTETLAPIKRSLPSKTFFSQHFSIWLGRQLAHLDTKKSFPFLTVFEYNVEGGFPAEPGRIKLEAPDEFAKEKNVQKISLDVLSQKSIWYVDKTGAALRIVMLGNSPDTTHIVERTTEEKAKKSL